MTARHRLARPITALALALATAAALAGAPATVYVYDGAGNVKAAINTSTDADNCGGVGAAYDCSTNHVTPACTAAVCSGTCGVGWGDCNGNKLVDGCETSLTSNANCGSCGMACETGQICEGSVCRVDCPPGTSDKCGDGTCYTAKQHCN